MSLSITLFTISDEPNVISKTTGTGVSFSGDIRGTGAVDVVRPEIMISGNAAGYNYAYISDFGRYYFIDEITRERTGLSIVRLRSDPLTSFASAIKSLPAIAGRVSGSDGTLYNTYLPDERMRLNASTIHGTWHMQSFSWGNNYVLITAG